VLISIYKAALSQQSVQTQLSYIVEGLDLSIYFHYLPSD